MRLNFITTTRADFSILFPLVYELDKASHNYRILAFGKSHFNTVTKDLSKRGLHGKVTHFDFNEKPNDVHDIVASLSVLNNIFSKIELSSDIDCIVVLGDRYELMPIVTGCFMLNLNIIHFCGGDRTLGSKDDIIRDVISRLSNYHFVTNSQSKKNLINLGLEQNSIFNVGHIPLQDMGPSKVDLVKLAKQINIVVRKQNILVTLHPDTTKF